MHWTNIGLLGINKRDADTFTSDAGIRLRQLIHPLVRIIIRMSSDRPIEVLKYPLLEKGTPYIFVGGTHFREKLCPISALLIGMRGIYLVQRIR